jgi:hypothetical protein
MNKRDETIYVVGNKEHGFYLQDLCSCDSTENVMEAFFFDKESAEDILEEILEEDRMGTGGLPVEVIPIKVKWAFGSTTHD